MISTHDRDEQTPSGRVSNIRFFNITCDSENGVFLSGNEGNHLEDISFEKVRITMHKKSKWPCGRYDLRPGYGKGIEEVKSAGFHLRKVDEVVLRDCQVTFTGEALTDFAEALYATQCKGVIVEGFKGKAAQEGYEAILIEGE